MRKFLFLLVLLGSYGCIGKEKRFTLLWPEKDLDFYLGRWNEYKEESFVGLGAFALVHVDTLEGSRTFIERHYFIDQIAYSFIPKEERKIKIKMTRKIEGKIVKEKIIDYTWSFPYWFRIILKKGLPILREKAHDKEEFILEGELEKYVKEDKICSIFDREYENAPKEGIEIKRGRKLKKKVKARIRYIKIDGVCWQLYGILEKGKPTFLMGQKTSPSRCNCVPEVCRLMSKVEIKLKKTHRPVKLHRWAFFNNKKLKLQAKMGVGKVKVKISYPPLWKEDETLRQAWRAMWEGCQEELKRGEKNTDYSPERSVMRDILMEVEIEKEEGELEKALVYLYQLGSPKGGKRLTWFDWAEVIEGEGKIELCNGDVAPALMFEDKECGKASLEFCLKTEEEIKAIKITRIRASNYAGEVWEGKVNLSAKIEGGE